MRRALLLSALVLIAPAPASAAGGGLFPSFGGAGATTPSSQFTYIASPSGVKSTIQAVNKDGGAFDRWRALPGSYGVPMVAMDGSTTGLSADGSTLVLVRNENRYPPKRTHLLVLDPDTFKTRTTVTLPGFNSVDAISPDGRWVYLVHYKHVIRDSTDYEVLAYDLRTHRLDPTPVIDKQEPDERMGGSPMTRVMSPDGRWAYTLYQAEEPFVHALDTVTRTAKCLDLDDLAGIDLSVATLKLAGDKLTIGSLATVDTTTREVARIVNPTATPVRTAAPVATATPAPVQDSGGSPWPIVAAGLAALALIAFAVHRRRGHSVEEVVDLQVAVDRPDQEPTLRQ